LVPAGRQPHGPDRAADHRGVRVLRDGRDRGAGPAPPARRSAPARHRLPALDDHRRPRRGERRGAHAPRRRGPLPADRRPAARPPRGGRRRPGPARGPGRPAGRPPRPRGRPPRMMQRRPLLQALPFAAAGLAGAGALPSCGSSGSGGEGGSNGELTWMSVVHTPTTPEASGPVETGLKEMTGASFSYQWVPDASKEEKVNAALASSSVADITTLNQLVMPSIRSALTSGLFWDVEEHLAEFPNLARINEAVIAGAKVDGALYGVPFQQPLARYGVLVRKDWLDRLGLEVPHTVEALGEVAQAFTEGDPTGTGAATTGFIDRAESFDWMFQMFAGYFGAGCKFELDPSGKVVPTFTTDAFKEAMEWYRNAYANGWVNQEFVTMQKQNQEQAIAQDKGGIVVTGLF